MIESEANKAPTRWQGTDLTAGHTLFCVNAVTTRRAVWNTGTLLLTVCAGGVKQYAVYTVSFDVLNTNTDQASPDVRIQVRPPLTPSPTLNTSKLFILGICPVLFALWSSLDTNPVRSSLKRCATLPQVGTMLYVPVAPMDKTLGSLVGVAKGKAPLRIVVPVSRRTTPVPSSKRLDPLLDSPAT